MSYKDTGSGENLEEKKEESRRRKREREELEEGDWCEGGQRLFQRKGSKQNK